MISKQDKILARVAHKNSLLTKKQLDRCLALMKKKKGEVNLPQSMVHLGYLSVLQVDRLMDRVEKALAKSKSSSERDKKTGPPKGEKKKKKVPPLPGQKIKSPAISGGEDYQLAPIEDEDSPGDGTSRLKWQATDSHPTSLNDTSAHAIITEEEEEEEEEILLLEDYDASAPEKARPYGDSSSPAAAAGSGGGDSYEFMEDKKEEWGEVEVPPDEDFDRDFPLPVAEEKDFASRVQNFGEQVFKAFALPFSIRGVFAIGSWLATLILVGIASAFIPFVGFVLPFWFWGAAMGTIFEIIITGAEEGSDLPYFKYSTELYPHVIQPLFLFLGAFFICMLPSLVYAFMVFDHQAVREIRGGFLSYGVLTFSMIFINLDMIHWLLKMAGFFFLPMAVLCMAIFRDLHALNPVFLFESIKGVWLRYLAVTFIVCLVITVYPFVVLVAIAYLGIAKFSIFSLLIAFMLPLLPIYIIYVVSYLLGLIYRGNKARLGW